MSGPCGGTPRSSRWRITHWPVWTLQPPALAVVIAVPIMAYTGLISGLIVSRSQHPEFVTLGMLLGLGIVHTEVAFGVERYRTATPAHENHTDLTSVWTFSSALLLPPAHAAAVASLIHMYLCMRLKLCGGTRYKQVYSNSTVVLSCLGAAGVLVATDSRIADQANVFQVIVILLAMAVYTVINTTLLVLAVRLTSDARRRWYGDDVLELVMLSLGAVVAMLFSGDHPAAIGFLVPALLMLHRAIAAEELDRRSGVDEATGLMNSAAWHRVARREVRLAIRRQLPVGVLLVDVDQFRKVNDTHGHIVGNRVLDAIGGALASVVRVHDTIGLNGGDEFVALLPAVDDELPRIAEKMVDAVRKLRVEVQGLAGTGTLCVVEDLSVSIGGAQWPEDGMTLEDLLWSADIALEEAKGQNAKRISYGTGARRRLAVIKDYQSARQRFTAADDEGSAET